MASKKILVSQVDRLPFRSSDSQDLRLQYLPKENDRYDQVLKLIKDFEAMIAVDLPVDARLLDHATQLKIISNYGVGYDNVDIAAAGERNITVTNTPNSTATPTAIFAASMMLSLLRKVTTTDRWIRAGRIKSFNDPTVLGTSPEGKVLGIIGMGRIGKELARIASSLGMSILYRNRRRVDSSFEKTFNCKYARLEDIAAQSDVVSIHVPLTSDTQELINEVFLRNMRPTAYIINTARGGVMNYDALSKVLEKGLIAGAGLDVFPNEPKIPPKFLQFENVILTPHNGTGTLEARMAMFDEALLNVKGYFEGGEISRVT